MKEVKLDILGRICIPKSMRDSMDLHEDSKVCITQVDDKIIISKNQINSKCPVCSEMFSSAYTFCPYCGQYLQKPQEDSDEE